MSEPLKLRASALPTAFLCPGSGRRGELVIDEVHELATLGTAAHEGHAIMVEQGRVDWDGVPELARKHGVDETELRVLLAWGQQIWDQIRDTAPNASTEVEFRHVGDDFELTGHVDVIAFVGNEAVIYDWKDAYLDSSYAEQWRAYAFLALQAYPDLERVRGGIMWVRDREVETYSLTRAQADEWLARLRETVVQWDGAYRVGTQCKHCRRSHECPARKALVKRDIQAFVEESDLADLADDADLIASMAPEDVVNGAIIAKRVKLYAERYLEVVREHAINNGEITGGDHSLVIQTQSKRVVDTRSAWPVLESVLDDDQMADVIEIRMSKVEDAVAKAAGKGNGAAAKRALKKALEEAGAVSTETVHRLQIRTA